MITECFDNCGSRNPEEFLTLAGTSMHSVGVSGKEVSKKHILQTAMLDF